MLVALLACIPAHAMSPVARHEVPAWAIGPYRFEAGDGAAWVADGSTVGTDGSGDWPALLTAASPDLVANGLAGALTQGMATVLRPGAPWPRLTDAERALLAVPSCARDADGTVRFAAFFGAPADGTVVRVDVVAAPGARALVTRTPIAALVPASARVDDLLLRAAAPDGPARIDVLAALGAERDPRATAALVAALADGWAEARQAAALALADQAGRGVWPGGTGAPVAALRGAVGTESDTAAAFAMVHALSGIGGPEAMAALQDLAARHPSASVRARAAAELPR